MTTESKKMTTFQAARAVFEKPCPKQQTISKPKTTKLTPFQLKRLQFEEKAKADAEYAKSEYYKSKPVVARATSIPVVEHKTAIPTRGKVSELKENFQQNSSTCHNIDGIKATYNKEHHIDTEKKTNFLSAKNRFQNQDEMDRKLKLGELDSMRQRWSRSSSMASNHSQSNTPTATTMSPVITTTRQLSISTPNVSTPLASTSPATNISTPTQAADADIPQDTHTTPTATPTDNTNTSSTSTPSEQYDEPRVHEEEDELFHPQKAKYANNFRSEHKEPTEAKTGIPTRA